MSDDVLMREFKNALLVRNVVARVTGQKRVPLKDASGVVEETQAAIAVSMVDSPDKK